MRSRLLTLLVPAAAVGALWLSIALSAAGTATARPHAIPKWKDPNGPPTESEVWLQRLAGRYEFDGVIEVVFYPDRQCAPLPPDPAQSENPPPPVEPFCRSVSGMGDCIAIGTGPGIQCILDVKWPDLYEVRYPEPDSLDARTGVFEVPGGVANLSPSMALYGMDPASGGLRYLLVDSKGIAKGTTGGQIGNRATFTTPCANSATLLGKLYPDRIDNRPPQTCTETVRLEAKPEAKVVFMSVDYEVNDELFSRYQFTLRHVEQTDVGSTVGDSAP